MSFRNSNTGLLIENATGSAINVLGTSSPFICHRVFLQNIAICYDKKLDLLLETMIILVEHAPRVLVFIRLSILPYEEVVFSLL
jgi:hypothetical protein